MQLSFDRTEERRAPAGSSLPIGIRVLTLNQPWATLMAIGAKTIETRSWGTPYRGLLAIHASKRFAPDDQLLCHREPFAAALTQAGYVSPRQLPVGAIVAVGTLMDVQQVTKRTRMPAQGSNQWAFGDLSMGRFLWYFEDVRPIDPVPARGALGIWGYQGGLDG